jgi:hypothetical protein
MGMIASMMGYVNWIMGNNVKKAIFIQRLTFSTHNIPDFSAFCPKPDLKHNTLLPALTRYGRLQRTKKAKK